MKVKYSGLLLLLFTFSFTQCIKENLDDCPPVDTDYNLILTFEYFDKEDKEIFDDRIRCIDVVLYDENQNLYQWLQADEVIGTSGRIKNLYVEPGTYYIISWANNFYDRSTRLNTYNSTLEDTYIYHDISTESTDELHYAPDLRNINKTEITATLSSYRVTVPPVGETRHTISFMSAHRTVNIYLKGFYEVTEDEPEVSVNSLAQYYDNFLNRGNENVSYKKKTQKKTIEEENLGHAGFFVPHFDNESPVTILIEGLYQTTGTPYQFSVTMDEILEELELIVEDGDDAVIDIVIEYKGTYVQVKIPKWQIIDVEPGFNG